MTAVPISTLPSPNTTLSGVRLYLARVGWMILTCLCLLLLALIAPRNPRSLLFDPLISDSYSLLASLMTYRSYLSYLVFLRYLVMGFFFLIALLIFWRKSNDWLILLTSMALICLPYFVLFGGVLNSLNHLTSWGGWLLAADGLITILGVLSIPLILLVFPDGRIEPRRLSKLVKWLLVILLIALLFNVQSLPALDYHLWFALLVGFLILLMIGVFGQFYRYLRISSPTQRQQTKWIIFSIMINLLWAAFVGFRFADFLRFAAASLYGLFELHASLVIVVLIPISMAISVLRYRLYDIDLIIRRTLVYSTLTGLLALIYFSLITLLQNLFSLISKQQSTLSIVLSTLTIAVLFNPLRKRLQDFIDRRFYRRKYDAEQSLAEFAEAARDETDLSQLSTRLTNTVQETLQPEQVSLWLKPTDVRLTGAIYPDEYSQ